MAAEAPAGLHGHLHHLAGHQRAGVETKTRPAAPVSNSRNPEQVLVEKVVVGEPMTYGSYPSHSTKYCQPWCQPAETGLTQSPTNSGPSFFESIWSRASFSDRPSAPGSKTAPEPCGDLPIAAPGERNVPVARFSCSDEGSPGWTEPPPPLPGGQRGVAGSPGTP